MAEGGGSRESVPAEDREGSGAETGGSLESFVTALQREGVEAGRREAERLKREAEERAAAVVRRAEEEAERIVSEAASRSEVEALRARKEVALVIRDAVLELQSALEDVLEAILARATEPHLEDPDFMAELIRELLAAYAAADASDAKLEVRVRPELEDQLRQWALDEVGAALTVEGADGLGRAGFEYRVAGGTVEVTVEAVVEKLHELVSPWLRDLVREAAATGEAEAETGAVPGGTPQGHGRA